MSYPFQEIEARWQTTWEEEKPFRTPDDRNRPSYYVLDMFPYPSGAGLHVGHPEGYTATDIVARYKRMRGFNVLHPMGWDAFGLPAERYAMQTNIHPAETTEKNIANFRRQLKSLGFSYDWEREVNTTDPAYYRWTQWIFLKLYNHYYDPQKKSARPISELALPPGLGGPRKAKERAVFLDSHRLAYIDEMPVNWCPGLGTVLANEEVDEWVSKGYTVERRPMRQWMLRITAYAERLLTDLSLVQWPAGTLELQKNWIGRSEGAEVEFPVAPPAVKSTAKKKVAKKKTKIDKNEIALRVFTTRPDTIYGVTYMVLAPEHPLVDRLTAPAQKKAVAAYVEATRKKSELERQVQGEKAEKTGVFTGAYCLNPVNGERIPVWIADYVLMGYGTGAIMAVPAHDERDFAFAKTFGLPIRLVIRPPGKAEKGSEFTAEPEQATAGPGVNVNSGILNGLETEAAIQAMILHLEKTGKGVRRVNFKLRDWLFSRQRYWGEPIPISFDEDGLMVAADNETLPLILPPCENFQPAESGESPLAKLSAWVRHTDAKGRKLRRETNTMPQWAGSCWYYLRYLDPTYETGPVNPEAERYWMGKNGVDLYVGGSEHAVLHLLYARFWHKFLFDIGVVKSKEPFLKLVHQGLILGEDGEKMSKSRGNVVNPDEVVAKYGADSFRLFEMFLGPLEQMKPWSSRGIEGVFRFLDRVWRLFTLRDENGVVEIDPLLLEEPAPELIRQRDRVLHQTIQKVTRDLERMSFNTSISQMMVFVNEFFQTKQLGREGAEAFVLLLAPFAPHIAEELWFLLGHGHTLTNETWPVFDPAKAAESEIEVVFQVNGKVRGKARVSPDLPEGQLKELALADEGVRKAAGTQKPKRIIVVKGRLVNVVL